MMDRHTTGIILVLFLLLAAGVAAADEQQKLTLDHSEGPFEVVLEDGQYVIYVVGPASFTTETGRIYCDSAAWRKGKDIKLNGHVLIDDVDYKLRADSVFYDVQTQDALARGKHVELWSYEDSIYAAGRHAFYSKSGRHFYMEERPLMYIGYPDSASMIEVVSNTLNYDAASGLAEAAGNVQISSRDVSTASGCAVLSVDANILDLFEKPRAKRGNSTIAGELISIYFDRRALDKIDVIDSAVGEFAEPIDSAETDFDRSILSGKRIIFDFQNGELTDVLCYGQAYSWYYPSRKGGLELDENTVSGDTIRFTIDSERLRQIDVIGGSVGTYVHGELQPGDSVILTTADTIDYDAHHIVYSLRDSLITMTRAAHVTSDDVALEAHLVEFDTERRLIEAFSASVDTINLAEDYADLYHDKFQPNTIPVVLRDKNEEVFGDYLAYSTDTEKGRIVQSKSEYEQGLYYGEKLYREQEHIFYISDGRYSTCDADEPHFHFHSKNMKLIEGEKLIARPVVFYIERIPLLAIPYYVFPLKRGRHSGFLPFTFGKFERGDRYVKNVGYYWAASEYWDWQGSFDYHEKSQNLTFNSRVNFRKRYVLDGYVSGSYLRDANYDRSTAAEFHRDRYVTKGAYNHAVTPSFNVSAYGDFVSDETYYSDFSLHREDLLNRSIKSQVSFSKKFGTNTSLSGNASHTVNLDDESRVDDLPTARLSLPTIWPFGNGRLNEEGQLERKWYHGFSLRYSPTVRNYSSRVTVEDSVIVVDGDSTVVTHRSRRKWAKIQHNPSVNLPALKLGNYLNVVPGFRYSETWFKIFETDQSLAEGIDATTTYRTYSYSAGVSVNTALYGTVYPGIAGLQGLRHVVNPSVSYSFSPDIDRHPRVRAYAGGGAGSRKSQVLSFRLQQSFQAKVKSNEIERNLELLSLTSGFSYNLEEEDRPYSSLSTTYQSRALGRITIDGSMTHSFYKPGTDSLHFWSPFLLNFSFNAHFVIGGSRFLFDETETARTAADSADPLSPTAPRPAGRGQGWSLSASYRYSESGRGQNWVKRSFIDFRLAFKLTPTTSISYSQYYDFKQRLTVRNSVNIVKTIHCWTGSLYWVPIGSNRGFGFKLFVSALPEIKIDNKHDSFLQTVRR